MGKALFERGRVQLERDHALDPRRRQDARRELRRARLAGVLAHVLARIGEIGNHGAHERRAGGARGIGDQGERDQALVGRRRERLHDEDICVADIVLDAHARLAVGERRDRGRGERDPRPARDLAPELRVCVA